LLKAGGGIWGESQTHCRHSNHAGIAGAPANKIKLAHSGTAKRNRRRQFRRERVGDAIHFIAESAYAPDSPTSYDADLTASSFVAAAAVGNDVEIVVIRQGKQITKTIKLGRLEDNDKQTSLAAMHGDAGKKAIAGPKRRWEWNFRASRTICGKNSPSRTMSPPEPS
jgi:hypothetical protein